MCIYIQDVDIYICVSIHIDIESKVGLSYCRGSPVPIPKLQSCIYRGLGTTPGCNGHMQIWFYVGCQNSVLIKTRRRNAAHNV